MKRSEIAEFFKRYGPMVYRRARQILGAEAEAEEAMQEVFIRALKGAESFDGRSQISTWLYRITTNYCLNVLRNRKRRRELFEERISGSLPTAAQARQPESLIVVRRLLEDVPDPAWASAVSYVIMDGMSHDEAAGHLGVSRRTVGNLIDRFTQWAQERLAHSPIKGPA